MSPDPGPLHPPGGQPDRALLADWHAGIRSGKGEGKGEGEGEGEAVRLHLVGCTACSAVLAELDAVSAALHRLADTPMPAEVADRLSASFAAEPPLHAGQSPWHAAEPPVNDATVTEAGRHRGGVVIELARERRVRRLRAVGAVAAGLIVFGGGGYLLTTLDSGKDSSSSAPADAAVAAGAGAPGVPAYDRSSLTAAIGALLQAPSAQPQVASGAPQRETALSEICLAALPVRADAALSVTRALYQGRDALVLLFDAADPNQVQVTVVSYSCDSSLTPTVLDEFVATR